MVIELEDGWRTKESSPATFKACMRYSDCSLERIRAAMNLVVASTMDRTGIGGGLSRPCCRGGWIQTVSAWILVLKLLPVRGVLLATCAGARWASHSWHVCSLAANRMLALAFLVFRT